MFCQIQLASSISEIEIYKIYKRQVEKQNFEPETNLAEKKSFEKTIVHRIIEGLNI